MAVDQGLVDWVAEAMEPLGTVTMRRMMGGATLYLDGTIFGIVHDGELWLKADAESDAAWNEAGHTERFTITFRTGMVDSMNYRRAPAEVHDDPDAMRAWAGLAVEAGARAPKKKPKRPRAG